MPDSVRLKSMIRGVIAGRSVARGSTFSLDSVRAKIIVLQGAAELIPDPIVAEENPSGVLAWLRRIFRIQ